MVVIQNNKYTRGSYENHNLRNELQETNLTSKSSKGDSHDIRNNENIQSILCSPFLPPLLVQNDN
jgi:hypothetical protein